jgi:hypothetical protein
VVYPTYNSTFRSITKPTETAYANYDWYRTDGTSCAVSNPTPDCGVQNASTLVTFSNTTEWTPETSTEKGNVTFYGVEAAPLTVDSVLPDNGYTDTANQEITITGTGFVDAQSVTVGGQDCESFTVISSNEITCVLPIFTSIGEKLVVVTGAYGESKDEIIYTVEVRPATPPNPNAPVIPGAPNTGVMGLTSWSLRRASNLQFMLQ